MENIKEYFDKQKREKEAFNIFKVLHKEADERYLHSRFISYLLSLNTEFLKSFLENLGIKEEDFEIKGCEVKPNKQDKSEFENIDILIFNEKQAIIVENKIFAGDQPRQLEKYYNTITTGINNDNKPIEIGKKKVVCISYLTLDGHEPTPQSLGTTLKIEDVKLINYTENITKWLDDCIAITPESDLLTSIYQYKKLVQELISDVKQAKVNQRILSCLLRKETENDVLKLKKYLTEDCFEVFKHIQWHTVDDFFNELSEALPNVTEKPTLEDISKVTHKETGKSIQKLILKFTYNGENLQIVNDTKGFTLGNLTKGNWGDFSDEIKNIKFCDFSNTETFRVINKDYRAEVIKKIVAEMKEKYLNLKNDFK